MLLERFYESFLHSFESRLSVRNWLIKLTFCAVLLSLFLAFPPYSLLVTHLKTDGSKLDAWVFIQNQAQDLFHPRDIDYDVRRENMVLRWTLPFLSLITNHNVVLILLTQSLCGILFLYRTGRYIYQISANKVLTGLFILALAHIFVSVWIFADIHGYGDGFAYFFLLTALLSNHVVISFLFLQLAFFTDERAVVAGGYVLLWWVVVKAYEKEDFTFPGLVFAASTGHAVVIWVAWLFYFGVRSYVLTTFFPEHNYSTIGTPLLLEAAHRNGLGSSIWSVFEGMWLLMGAAMLALFLTERYWLAAALSIGFILLIMTGVYVHDIDRSLSYGFPFILIAFYSFFAAAYPVFCHAHLRRSSASVLHGL
jgi:hypothetical protein